MVSYEWPIWYLDFYEEYWWKSVWKKITSGKLTNIDFLMITKWLTNLLQISEKALILLLKKMILIFQRIELLA